MKLKKKIEDDNISSFLLIRMKKENKPWKSFCISSSICQYWLKFWRPIMGTIDGIYILVFIFFFFLNCFRVWMWSQNVENVRKTLEHSRNYAVFFRRLLFDITENSTRKVCQKKLNKNKNKGIFVINKNNWEWQ